MLSSASMSEVTRAPAATRRAAASVSTSWRSPAVRVPSPSVSAEPSRPTRAVVSADRASSRKKERVKAVRTPPTPSRRFQPSGVTVPTPKVRVFMTMPESVLNRAV